MRRAVALAVVILTLVASYAVSALGEAEPPQPAEAAARPPLPVRGLHVLGASTADVALYERFIRDALPKEGVNVLVWEVDYDYAYQSYPQLASADGVTREDVQRVANACREVGIRLVPQINCLGHQSWHQYKGALLRAFPEFDETPWVPDNSPDLYCRSYCPLHPDAHKVVFALMDELADAAEATDFHVGMDEVFYIADAKCPRCGGKDPAVVFAGEVQALHDHLAAKGRTMWMWGDRFIDAQATGIGYFEASGNGTYPAADLVPKDIVVCDWHYERVVPTPAYFLGKGFGVAACPCQDEQVALGQLEMMRTLRQDNERALGMLQTTWCGFGDFVRAYYGEGGRRDAQRAVRCFKALFAAMRAPA
jgi:hypothetical protein